MKAVKIFFLVIFVFISGLFAQNTNDSERNIRNNGNTTKEKVIDEKSNTDKIETTTELPNSNTKENLNIPISKINESDERYRIGFQDVLQISIKSRYADLSDTVSVAPDGTIILPRLNDPIVAVCKTERELSTLITELYKKYFRQPYVNVRTLEQRSQPFSVVGAVNKPGQFFGTQRITLLQLIAFAGGHDVENAGSRVQVARLGNIAGCGQQDQNDQDVQFFSYDLNEVLSGKVNPWMQPGDIVSILIAEEAYVVGDVIEPTKITLKEDVTLSEAIAQAGGMTDTAKTTKVVIHRKEKGNPIRTELVFNLKDIRANKAEDPIIQGNDIIEISTSQGKVIKKGLLDILFKGLPNIFYRIPL